MPKQQFESGLHCTDQSEFTFLVSPSLLRLVLVLPLLLVLVLLLLLERELRSERAPHDRMPADKLEEPV